jgi:hypothetical protein
MLDSPEGVCAAQGRLENPATSVPFSNSHGGVVLTDLVLGQGPRQSRDLSGSYHRHVGPVSGGRQLGVWRRESDWRPTRTFRYCARAWPVAAQRRCLSP